MRKSKVGKTKNCTVTEISKNKIYPLFHGFKGVREFVNGIKVMI